jgi:excisionase family DNA binding protein
MISTEPTAYTIAEAALRLNLSPKTVRQRIKRGELRAHLIEGPHGPEYRVPKASLENVSDGYVFPSWAGQGTLENGQGRVGNGTVEADSPGLNAQARRAGQATLNGTLEAPGETDRSHAVAAEWGNGNDRSHRADLAEQERDLLRQERDHLKALLEVRTEELRRRDQAEEQLRVMLARLENTNASLAEALVVKSLPPAPEPDTIQQKHRVRWWIPWRRN